MKIMKVSFLALTVLALLSVAPGTQLLVPGEYEHIQQAIIEADDGDTVSVWGEEGVPPPYTYNENLICNEKSILIVNRSFLPDGGTGYDSSWDHVVIDGTQNGPVVEMHDSAAVLKGFTIQNGLCPYGGGVCCYWGFVVKNHIHHNQAAYGGGVRCYVYNDVHIYATT